MPRKYNEEIEQKIKDNNLILLDVLNKDKEKTLYYKSDCYIRYECKLCHNIWVKRIDHFLTDYSCKKCSQTKRKISKQTYMSNIEKLCNDKKCIFIGFYDKNKNETKWFGNKTYLKLQCQICDYIWYVQYTNFVSKYNYSCPKCANNVKLTNQEAEEKIQQRCSEINDTFLYFCDKNGSKCDYNNNRVYIKVFCNKCLKPYVICFKNFIYHKQSCSNCKKTNGEKDIEYMLNKNSINFIYRDKNILKYNKLELDFFIPKYNTAIEVQGGQHFYSVDHWGGDKSFNKQIENDIKKQKLCEEYGIKLLYYSQLNITFPYQVYTDTNKLLKEIIKNETNTN